MEPPLADFVRESLQVAGSQLPADAQELLLELALEDGRHKGEVGALVDLARMDERIRWVVQTVASLEEQCDRQQIELARIERDQMSTLRVAAVCLGVVVGTASVLGSVAAIVEWVLR